MDTSVSLKGYQIGVHFFQLTSYYRVKAIKAGLKDSLWVMPVKGCAMPGTATVTAPASLTAPTSDADGAYAVSWAASTTADVKYSLEEATDSTFTTGLRTIYFGTDTSKALTGRVVGKTYYYRVQAVKPGFVDSGKRSGVNGVFVGAVSNEARFDESSWDDGSVYGN